MSEAESGVQSLIPWFRAAALSAEEDTTTDVQIKLRGNILHALCQSSQSDLVREDVLMRLVRSLMQPDIQSRFASEFPQVHQIYIYNRRIHEAKPIWSAPVYLNRLDRHLERLVAAAGPAVKQAAIPFVPKVSPKAAVGTASGAALEAAYAEALAGEGVQSLASDVTAESMPVGPMPSESAPAGPVFTQSVSAQSVSAQSVSAQSVSAQSATASPAQISDLMLARKGDSAAIARYLSEALGALNVGVKVNARVVPGKVKRSAVAKSSPNEADLNNSGLNESNLNASAPNTSEPASADNANHIANTETSPDGTSTDSTTAEDAAGEGSTQKNLISRLWVFCEASYSPDPLLIAEPIAQRLRQLHLRQFHDAVITIQVTGEAASDWRLRVDLTPSEDMLREWGRWGDLPALSLLVNHISRRYGLKLVTEIKRDTLHLISYVMRGVASKAQSYAEKAGQAVDVDRLVDDLSGMLTAIAPQGIHRAMLYGPSADDISPEWLRGIDLPAANHAERQGTTLSLAAEGDMSALAYCLTRALNPDIKEQLSTGGIRVQLLLKEKLLHIMADGPVCPPKNAIVPLINQILEEVDAPTIAEGIRLYGRRAGQKQPIWTHGKDYQSRQRMVPEAKPEFAASEAYIGELITPVGDGGLADAAEAEEDVKLTRMLARAVQFALLKSQVFIPADDASGLRTAKTSGLPKAFQAQSKRMALIWGGVGLFLAVQFDFLVGQALRQAAAPVVEKTAQVASGGAARRDASARSDARANATLNENGAVVERVKPNGFDDELAKLDWNGARESARDRERVSGRADSDARTEGFFASAGDSSFSGGDFTASSINDDELIYSPQQGFVSTESLLASSNIPSFRSQQLDEKLALYRRRVAQSGPPDVLIIGSSRALRGVDPAALRQALGAAGHDGLSFFNFGVNGATAQVVDLIVRRLIPPDQLPQIIVWADGARAFNSGRTDVTFNAIATSEGYQQLEATDTPGGINDLAFGSLSDQLTQRAQTIDKQLSEFFGQVSSGYTNRNKIRTALSQSFGAIAPSFTDATGDTRAGDTPTGEPTETSLIDLDGFLALSTRFNPATYYQEHALVKGAYDGDYKAFQLEGAQTTALNSLLQFTVSKQVPIIFINTPLTDEYLDNHRTQAEDIFLQYMVQVSDRSNAFLFRDFGRIWPQRYDYFSDPSHLNRYGAYQVSARLAQDPLIEWPEPLSEEDGVVE
ncbi:MAG: hypothetical protein AB8B99_19475 [Phormidesmis sp.]